ncbi:YdcF family protein [Halorhodospira halochloris]|uniref:YdcF family protein n=1 Tax=Halorhodospira halochloris TaxID=1052 RepID=UPI003B75BDE6
MLSPRVVGALDYQAIKTNVLANFVMIISFGLTLVVVLISIIRFAIQPTQEISSCDWVVVPGHALANGKLSREYKIRLCRAVRLLRRFSGAKLMLLGGCPPGNSISEAKAAACYVEQLGVSRDRIVLEEQSQHTLENFQRAAKVLVNYGGKDLILVTSRYHLCRAVTMARNLGISVQPYPAELRWRLSSYRGIGVLWEAYLMHWYQVGVFYAKFVQNQEMLERVIKRQQ